MAKLVRIFDPYAMALSLLVGLVGFGMTFFFNTNISYWGMNEIAYPALAMASIYTVNRRRISPEVIRSRNCVPVVFIPESPPTQGQQPSKGYVYLRNARFFETDQETAKKLFDSSGSGCSSSFAGEGAAASAASGTTAQKVRAPPTDAPGLRLVAGAALTAPKEGALAVVIFFATWCANSKRCLPGILSLAERYAQEGITFAGVTRESVEDLKHFVETYQRPVKSLTLLSDEQGALTDEYQGAHGIKTIPHCYVLRGEAGDAPGVIEWHGHPTNLEGALSYLMDVAEEEREGETEAPNNKEESVVAGGQ